MVEIDRELEGIDERVISIRSAREQVEALVERLVDQDGRDSMVVVGRGLVEGLNAMEDSLVQKRTADGQTVLNYPSRLNLQYVFLRGVVDGAEGLGTEGAQLVTTDGPRPRESTGQLTTAASLFFEGVRFRAFTRSVELGTEREIDLGCVEGITSTRSSG